MTSSAARQPAPSFGRGHGVGVSGIVCGPTWRASSIQARSPGRSGAAWRPGATRVSGPRGERGVATRMKSSPKRM